MDAKAFAPRSPIKLDTIRRETWTLASRLSKQAVKRLFGMALGNASARVLGHGHKLALFTGSESNTLSP